MNWLLKTRDDEYGWGDETTRAITALYLSDPDFVKNKNEQMLMKMNLHLKLSLALNRNKTQVMTLSELASYINALHATCDNPRNFHGNDLIDILRRRTNAAQRSAKYVGPFVYLTLCISNYSIQQDLQIIKNMSIFSTKYKIGTQALTTLAATCIQNIPDFSSSDVALVASKSLYDRIKREGMPGNVYELALVVQVLNGAKINPFKWGRFKSLTLLTSMQQHNGSFGDILSTYYALPVFSGKTIASLAGHCHRDNNGIIPLEVLMNGREKGFVTYSLRFSDSFSFCQDLSIKIGESMNFFDIMRVAEEWNPLYRFKYDTSSGKLVVYSIGGIVDDAEHGLYWTMYVRTERNGSGKFMQFTDDIRKFIPSVGDHITFWLKNIFEDGEFSF